MDCNQESQDRIERTAITKRSSKIINAWHDTDFYMRENLIDISFHAVTACVRFPRVSDLRRGSRMI